VRARDAQHDLGRESRPRSPDMEALIMSREGVGWRRRRRADHRAPAVGAAVSCSLPTW
jgi:hypothetical protein